MKTILAALLICMSRISVQAQTQAIQSESQRHSPIPRHVAYRHFLGMVNDLENRATAAGETDPYKFAQPFAHTGLENGDLDVLRQEAKALTVELAQQDMKIKAVVSAFREQAQQAAEQRQALPPEPQEIRLMETMRTTIMVHHMVALQKKLGPGKTARLEAYLDREFTPKLSLRQPSHPPAKNDPSVPTQALTIDQ